MFGGAGIPSRQSVANSTACKDSIFASSHDAVAPFPESLSTVHRAPYLANFNQVQDTVDAQLDSVWSLKSTPADVLPKVCAKVQPLLSAGAAPGGG